MSLPGWLNDNQFRQYPLVARTSETDALDWPPESTIVDFGCILGPDIPFDTATDYVWLMSIERVDANTLEFTFGCSATDQTLVFTVPTDTPEFKTIDAESEPETEDACDAPPAWEGYLQIGLLEAILEILGVGDSLTGTTAMRIEPGRIQTLASSYLRSISMGNQDRVRAIAPDGCGGESIDDSGELDILTQALCISGPIRFQEGYNCAIRQNRNDNSLTFSASVGAGAGQACDEIPLTESEESISDELLTGGPACNDRITAINGVMGEVIQLTSTQGAAINIDPDNPSKLIVDFSLQDLARCDAEESVVLEE